MRYISGVVPHVNDIQSVTKISKNFPKFKILGLVDGIIKDTHFVSILIA
jgi:hypothetical protein